MRIQQIDHIAIAVRNLEETLSRWVDLFQAKIEGVEELKERGVKVAHLRFETQGNCALELVSPLGENLPLRKFLEEKGEGIHHFCLRVRDIKEAMRALMDKGLEFVQDKPVRGAEGSRIAFIHPRSLGGVLVELKEVEKQI